MSPKKGIPRRRLVPGVTWYRKESWPRPGSLPRACLSFVQVRFSRRVCRAASAPAHTTAVCKYFINVHGLFRLSVSSIASPTHHRFRRAPRAFAVLRRRCSHASDRNSRWGCTAAKDAYGARPLVPLRGSCSMTPSYNTSLSRWNWRLLGLSCDKEDPKKGHSPPQTSTGCYLVP